MYHCYQIHCKMHNNINTCLHLRKKKVCRFHYPSPPMHETKNLENISNNGNYPFSQQCFHTQAKKKI